MFIAKLYLLIALIYIFQQYISRVMRPFSNSIKKQTIYLKASLLRLLNIISKIVLVEIDYKPLKI